MFSIEAHSSGASRIGDRARRTRNRVLAGTVVATITIAGVAYAGTTSASAATLPNAQSVGRFVDGSLGGKPIQGVADVHDARATAPGTQSQQNPLDVTLLNKLNLDLNNALKLPQLLGITLGAANQVAVAHNDGFSYGASGAVLNSGGVSVGGNDNAFPANATINLTAAGIAGNGPITIPGATAGDLLGGIQVSIGAVSALAQTPVGYGKPGTTNYGVAGLNLVAESPLLGSVVGKVGGSVATLLGKVLTLLGGPLPSGCTLASGTLPNLSLEGGAITINSSTGALTINLDALLTQILGPSYNLNHLPANTDVIDLLLNFIGDPNGLALGIANAISGLVGDLKTNLLACTPTKFHLGINLLFGSLGTLQLAINKLLSGLKTPVGGKSVLAPLGTLLKKVVDIGINVQPNGPAGTFKSGLAATPNQATPVVPGQTIVRAIEVDLLGSQLGVVSLANAAAGPSTAPPGTPTPPTTGPPNSNPPTGVNAGQGTGGSPAPLILLIAGLFLASGGAVAFKMRGRFTGSHG